MARTNANAGSETSAEGEGELENVKEHLSRNKLKYVGQKPEDARSKEMERRVGRIIVLIQQQLDEVFTLNDLVDVVHAAADTVCEIHKTIPTI
ncbi:hypothetical protein HHI36_004992 [Cryptolaemus montrouzieri]|uniref:Uncharacterized protein n=1 Tax=Cryptolaemus montrouzieri TaxID=559131 RepID=A0ABD2NSV5_9CUCU